MKQGNGYAVLKPKDWTPPRRSPAQFAEQQLLLARVQQLQNEAPRRTYPQVSHIGRIFIPSSMCPLCIEQKRQKAAARAFWDHQPAPVLVTDETDDAIERFIGIIGERPPYTDAELRQLSEGNWPAESYRHRWWCCDRQKVL